MSLALNNDPCARYFVRFDRTVFGGMFIVIDGFHGTYCGEHKFFQQEAERLRDRLNNEQRALKEAA